MTFPPPTAGTGTMRAIVLDAFGGPNRLTVRTLPLPPAPGAHEILVRTVAAAVNPVDLQTRAGLHASHSSVELPMILGWDVAGVVEATGSAVTFLRAGDRVIAMSAQMATGRGTYAERVVLPADLAAPAPRSIPLEEAAALPLAGLTALQALDRLALAPGERLLVTGALGAVGACATQLAVLHGVHVTAHVRDPRRAHEAKALGADHVCTQRELIPRSCDAMLDTAGLPELIETVRPGGRAISIVPTRPLPHQGDIATATSHVEQSGEQLARLVRLVDDGQLRLRPGLRLAFEQARRAHELLAGGGLNGKVLLLPALRENGADSGIGTGG
ncbi:NADP-dependent oxidoreductase [Streptomyces sp. NPDC006184]|uniref:NADP-dependent oxidoreductase n=1 Tax=Streptomyces sp. NPDC006184 TaxID=3155455 RepID=UPI00339E4F95